MKKVKAVEIAKKLGISKSTVSLALNNRPGVSEQTRQEIFACKESLENQNKNQSDIFGCVRLIKLLFVERGLNVEWGANMEFPGKVMAAFDSEAKKDGFAIGISYVKLTEESINSITIECMHDQVAGVILLATELKPDDIKRFCGIKKPMVVYDCDLVDGTHHCIIPDNRRGVQRAMGYLFSKGIKNIIYLANKVDIYNFRERRKAFLEVFLENNLMSYLNNIIEIGTTTESVYQNMKLYLKHQDLPQAFLMESYQISVGVMRALSETQIDVPKDVSLIGIDEVPEFYAGGVDLTTIKIPHKERAKMAVYLLKREMEEALKIKSRVLTDCLLIEGNSVK